MVVWLSISAVTASLIVLSATIALAIVPVFEAFTAVVAAAKPASTRSLIDKSPPLLMVFFNTVETKVFCPAVRSLKPATLARSSFVPASTLPDNSKSVTFALPPLATNLPAASVIIFAPVCPNVSTKLVVKSAPA